MSDFCEACFLLSLRPQEPLSGESRNRIVSAVETSLGGVMSDSCTAAESYELGRHFDALVSAECSMNSRAVTMTRAVNRHFLICRCIT